MKLLTMIVAVKLILAATLLILFLGSCKKEVPASVPTHQFTATVYLTPTDSTVAYDIFLSDDKKMWIWALRIDKPKTNPFSFGFDFSGLVCNGILYADPNKKLYGATRELVAHGNY